MRSHHGCSRLQRRKHWAILFFRCLHLRTRCLTAPVALLPTMLRAALLALTAPVALAVDPVDELTMAIRNGSPREALEKTQVWLRSPSGFREDDSHVGYSGGPGEGRIVSPRLG